MKTIPLAAVMTFLAAFAGPLATAQDYDFTWATIGAEGNRATLPHEVPLNPGLSIGSVSYRYRLSVHEVTATQWLEFVNAYAPYHEGARNDVGFTGVWISPTNLNPDEPPDYRIDAGAERFPTTMSWYMAARYMNWLHNGKALNQEAFENGAYDTSTFGGVGPDGLVTDQLTRSEGARFWIPSRDELTKGLYFDPTLNDGAGGYWLMPNAGNTPLMPGMPGSPGAETNAGLELAPPFGFDVGSYADVRSPWGLFDGSGGVHEWTEASDPTRLTATRGWMGTAAFSNFPEFFDRLDMNEGATSPLSGLIGLRVASIPAPGSLALLVILPLYLCNTRRRPCAASRRSVEPSPCCSVRSPLPIHR